jgi:hypothetical protein
MNLEVTLPRAQEHRPGSWALALKDVRTVGPVFMATVSAAQHVDVLVVVCASKVGSTDNDLPVSVPVARLGRPLTHSAQYTNHQIRAVDPWAIQRHPEAPSSGADDPAREKGRKELRSP